MTDLDDWAELPRYYVWDMGASSYNKFYFQRQNPGYLPQPGETWLGTAKYRCFYDASHRIIR